MGEFFAALGGVSALAAVFVTVYFASNRAINGKIEAVERRMVRCDDDARQDRDRLHEAHNMLRERVREDEEAENMHRNFGVAFAKSQHAALMRWSDAQQQHDPDWPGYAGPDPAGWEDGMKGRTP